MSTGGRTREHDAFYDAEALVIRGIQNWMGHAIAEAKRLAEVERHPVLRQNLLDMAEVNEHILEAPPATLREACQWVCWFNMGQPHLQPGRGGLPAGPAAENLLRPGPGRRPGHPGGGGVLPGLPAAK